METEKSQDLHIGKPETQGSPWHKSLPESQRQGEKKKVSQLKIWGRRRTPHWRRVRVSVLSSPFEDCLRPIPTREDKPLFPDYQFRYSVHPETPSQTHPG